MTTQVMAAVVMGTLGERENFKPAVLTTLLLGCQLSKRSFTVRVRTAWTPAVARVRDAPEGIELDMCLAAGWT